MIVEERVIQNARRGEKEAFQLIFSTYHPLFRYFFTYLLRNEKWVKEQLPIFYQELYQKLPSLQDDCNFEKWAMRLIYKQVRLFFAQMDQYKSLEKNDLLEVLDAKYPFVLFDTHLDRNQEFIMVCTRLYALPLSFLTQMLGESKSEWMYLKKQAETTLNHEYCNDFLPSFKEQFLLHYDVQYTFEDLCGSIHFTLRTRESENRIQGPLKTLILFVAIFLLGFFIFYFIRYLK